MASPQCAFSDVLIDHIYFSKALATVIHKYSSSPLLKTCFHNDHIKMASPLFAFAGILIDHILSTIMTQRVIPQHRMCSQIF